MREYQLIHGQTVDDAHLVAAAQEGHEWAFARLFERHSARLWPYVCALSGGEVDEAQDLLQETFVRAWSRLGELQAGAAFHAWLRTLVYRLAIDRGDKQQHRDQLLTRYAMVAEGERTPEQRLLSREIGAAIAEAAQSLSESSRRIFTAFHIDDKSIMEISEEMGLSVGAVKARLFQGRKRLRKELENMAPETTMPMETPETFNFDIFGERGRQHDPLHPLRQTDNLLAQRLLYFCRKGAKSAEELARLLHADRAYVQDIVPGLVEGEILEEPFPGRYQTAFLFMARQEYLPLEESVHSVREGVAILKRHLPQLREALSHTSLCGWQGFTWEELAWVALPEWIVVRGLGRQVPSLPNWGKHRILTYPLRPVDFWYLLGHCGVEKEPSFRVGGVQVEGGDMGMGNIAEPRLMVGGDCMKLLRFADLDRFVGGLCEEPISEEDLLRDADEEERSSLEEYSEEGYLVQLEDGRWRLGMPVVTGADEERLIGTIDAICAELAGNVLDGAITAFAEKVDELEFSHLLGQPHYLGFLGFSTACKQLIVACREEGLIPDPVDPPKGFGCHAWYGVPRMMRAWSKGR